MKRKLLFLICALNRNIRYGNSKSRIIQYIVIRIRFYLKKIISKNNHSISKYGAVKINLPYAGYMKLNTADYVDNWLFTGADFEPSVVRATVRLLKSGDNFIDLGANIGYFSLIAARVVGVDGKVFAFEPSPIIHARLLTNITLNKIENIKVFNRAVSSLNGKAIFKIPTGDSINSGRSSFRNIEESHSDVEVETIALDSILDTLPTIRLIKMDIEGAEGMALEGMNKLIQRDKPTIIFELSDNYLKQMGYSASQILSLLWRNGYLTYSGEDFKEQISFETVLEDRQYDILAECS